jgi:hypothetical protein
MPFFSKGSKNRSTVDKSQPPNNGVCTCEEDAKGSRVSRFAQRAGHGQCLFCKWLLTTNGLSWNQTQAAAGMPWRYPSLPRGYSKSRPSSDVPSSLDRQSSLHAPQRRSSIQTLAISTTNVSLLGFPKARVMIRDTWPTLSPTYATLRKKPSTIPIITACSKELLLRVPGTDNNTRTIRTSNPSKVPLN